MNYAVRFLIPIITLVFVFNITGTAQKLVDADVVLQWNRVAYETIGAGVQPATVHSGRTTSMVHLAMFDAINSIEGGYNKYLTEVPGTKHASAEAAAAKAARDILVALFPTRQSIYDAELAMSLDGIEENRAKQGIMVGEIVAANMLAARANDGWSATPPPYVLPATPGNWQPTPPANAAAAFTHFGSVMPFATTSGSQFTPNPPPAITSAQYAADFNETKTIGSATSVTRTAEQTQIALIWANGPASAVTWNNVARSVAIARGNSLAENARLFALLQIAYHDSLQQTFASKYAYGLWRPITAIRRADEDGNPGTDRVDGWTPLIATPPYPTYAGNAAGHSMGQATILAQFFGRDDIPFATNFVVPGSPPVTITRLYPGFTSMADEQARSRIYGGIHFAFDTTAGQSIGRNVANYIFANFLTRKCTAN